MQMELQLLTLTDVCRRACSMLQRMQHVKRIRHLHSLANFAETDAVLFPQQLRALALVGWSRRGSVLLHA